MLFNLGFSNKTVLLCFFFFFLIIDLFFLTPTVIAQISNPIAELAISKQKAKPEVETHLHFLRFRSPVKLIWCIAFGSTSSACCLL